MEINANHAENFVLKYSLLSFKQVKIYPICKIAIKY